MTITQKIGVGCVLAVLVATCVLQTLRLSKVRQEAERLRSSANMTGEQLTRLQADLEQTQKDQLQNRKEHLELLSLRGRVKQSGDELHRPDPSAPAPFASSDISAQGNSDSILFSISMTNAVPRGETLVAGGWRQDGMRRYLLITPDLRPENEATNGERIAVQTQVVAAPESFWSDIGWGEAKSETHRCMVAGLLKQPEMELLLSALKSVKGSERSNVSEALRKEGDYLGLGFSVDNEAGTGMMLSLDVHPRIGRDGNSVVLEMVPSDMNTNGPIHPSLRQRSL